MERQNFALIGAHPDGLAMAGALVESGHLLGAVAGPGSLAEPLRQAGFTVQIVDDVEALLARPEIELVIVADDLEHRPAVLRRALQSEKHVLCVHPADVRLDVVYEAVLIQKDTRGVLFPLLAERLMPGVLRLQELLNEGVLGKLQVIECERRLPAASRQPPQAGKPSSQGDWAHSPLVRLWEPLRALGGEIIEVSALASATGNADEEHGELRPDDPLTLTGRFERGSLFRVLVLSEASGQPSRLVLRGEQGRAELSFQEDLAGPSELRIATEAGEQVVSWTEWKPWSALAKLVNACCTGDDAPSRLPVSWRDEIRSLELFDAARRSVRDGRVVPMHYGEITEESTFKGVMTAAGCGLLWLVLVLVIAGVWAPWLWYAIVPLLVLFLVLQLLRWAVPAEKKPPKA